MDGKELIQVNFQLPASVLDGLSRLVDQMRRLAETVQAPQNAQPAETVFEQGRNSAFDLAKFRDLRVERELPEARSSQSRVSREVMPAAVDGQVSQDVPRPDAARREVDRSVEDPASAGASAGEAPDAVSAGIPAFRTVEDGEDVIENLPEAEGDTPAPAAAREGEDDATEARSADAAAESNLPDAASAEKPVWAREDLFPPRREELTEDLQLPGSAGFSVSQGPDLPGSRWAMPENGGFSTAPAPVSPEDVSLAFQRDGRRYDSGFPLY